jgi:anti-sigma factor RsiW
MTQPRIFTSEDLTAYLDGEADATLVHDIEGAVSADAELRLRLASLTIQTGAVKSAFDAILPVASAYPATIESMRNGPPAMTAWRTLAATALICLGLGWTASTLTTRAKTETWQHYAATYHAMYVNGTLSHVTSTPAITAEDMKRVSDALGLAIDPAALAGVDQLDFKRAQVLGFDGRPVAQLAFLSTAGAPIALCITRTDAAQPRAVYADTVLGMASATWSKGAHEYLLIGGTDAALIAKAAAVFVRVL